LLHIFQLYFPFREVRIKQIATVVDLALEFANWTLQNFQKEWNWTGNEVFCFILMMLTCWMET